MILLIPVATEGAMGALGDRCDIEGKEQDYKYWMGFLGVLIFTLNIPSVYA